VLHVAGGVPGHAEGGGARGVLTDVVGLLVDGVEAAVEETVARGDVGVVAVEVGVEALEVSDDVVGELLSARMIGEGGAGFSLRRASSPSARLARPGQTAADLVSSAATPSVAAALD
jgi:hypothetical protein